MDHKTIRHYRILGELGRGGMGVVYKARDVKLDRIVALKFLSQQLTSKPDSVERFVQEAKTASALDQANVCTIYEINETDDGQLFIAMAFYEGQTLRQAIENDQLSADDAIDIAIQVGEGLSRAHEAGIIHRDIKPENVIITNYGEVKILDFGLAKLSKRTESQDSGDIVGTVAYMSPEQTQGSDVDHRTDIWALGVTLYQMLTGQLPFTAEYDHAILYSIVHEDPIPLQDIRSDISPDLQIIIDRALKKDAAERYESVREMIGDMQGLSEDSFRRPAERAPEIEAADKRSFLPDYENDVFVSYAHIDDQPLSEGQKGWILKFHQALEIRLEQLLGEDTRVLRQPGKSRRPSASSALPDPEPIPDAAIMLSVVSPQYVKSDSCVREVKSFYEKAESDTGVWISDKARIFKAVKTFVPVNAQPEELQTMPDYEFYGFHPDTGRPQEFWPELGAETNQKFWERLEDIAYDIYLLLETLKARESKSAAPTSVSSRTDATAVFLAETTNDLSSVRDKIRRQLQQRRLILLPDRPLPLDAARLEERVREDMQRCALSVHLIGEKYGVVPEGETRSIAELQFQLASEFHKQNGFTSLVWMTPGLAPQDTRQIAFIDGLKQGGSLQVGDELLQTSLEEFKSFLLERVDEKPKLVPEPVPDEGVLRIYLQCEERDIEDTEPLEEYLYNEGYEIKLPAFEGDAHEVFEAHRQNLLLCDATVIYCGVATDAWLSAKLADLQKIAGYGRTEPMRAKAVYLAGPETRLKQRFRTREAMTVKNFGDFSPEPLAEFVAALKQGPVTMS